MKTIKSLLGLLVLLGITSQAVVSCYDDNALWDELENLENRIDELDQKLNAELKALSDMIDGKVTISECIENEDGTYSVTLSSGVSFVIYPQYVPEEGLSAVITYVEQGGVKYWAVYDKDGNKTILTDKDGYRIPIESETPEVVTVDGENFLVIGGQKYPLGAGSSVFSDYEVIVDEATGEVLAVTFAFGEGMSFTVTVDGSHGFRFIEIVDGASVPLNELYVSAGATAKVIVEVIGVEDYILQIPDGWRVNDVETADERYFEITAPKAELVEIGYAIPSGELKLVAVLEGGKSVVSKLILTSEAFKEFRTFCDSAIIDPYYGVERFVYGVCETSAYDQDAILAQAEKIVSEGAACPAGYAVADAPLNRSLAEILPSITIGEEYMMWAVPAYKSGKTYTVGNGSLTISEFKYTPVSMEVTDVNFSGATLNFEVKGLASYYAGVAEVTATVYDDIVLALNAGTMTPLTESSYSGQALAFGGASLTPKPETTYVVWFVDVHADGVYASSDLLTIEFTTTGISAGGSVAVTAGTEETTPRNVLVPLSAEGAGSIYYGFLTPTNATRYPDEASRATFLLSSGKCINGSEGIASADYLNLNPSTAVKLFAMAVDSEGKYGSVYEGDFKTGEISYNDIVVNLEFVNKDPGEFTFSISSTGGTAEKYIYWVGEEDSNFWTSKSFLGGTVEGAQKYMFLNYDAKRFEDMAATYPIVDGQIVMPDLKTGVSYVFVAVALDADGLTSKATVFIFTTRTVRLGDVVMAMNEDGTPNQAWVDATPTIEWIEKSFHAATGQALDGTYSYNFSCSQDYTAYVMSGADGYFSSTSVYDEIPLDEKIITIVEQTDRVRDYEILYDDHLWETEGYPAGHYLYHAPHGCPLFGYGVIFPGDSESHKDECSRPEKCVDYNGGIYGTRMLDIYFNTGEPICFRVPGAFTKDDIDKVYVALKDKNGNFYEPYRIDVPDEYFGTPAE